MTINTSTPATSRILWHDVEPDQIKIDKLVSSMTQRRTVIISSPYEAPHCGVVNMIEAEDGSGHNFNINVANMVKHTSETFYIDVHKVNIQLIS